MYHQFTVCALVLDMAVAAILSGVGHKSDPCLGLLVAASVHSEDEEDQFLDAVEEIREEILLPAASQSHKRSISDLSQVRNRHPPSYSGHGYQGISMRYRTKIISQRWCCCNA